MRVSPVRRSGLSAPDADLGAYREYLTPGSQVVSCTWARHHDVRGPVLVVPDGCVDLIWWSDGQLLVAGPDTTPKTHAIPCGLSMVGVRLRTGTAGAIVGVPMTDLVNQLVSVEEYWGPAAQRVADRVGRAASTTERRVHLVREGEARATASRMDLTVMAAADAIVSGHHTTASLAGFTGIAGRQLRRRFAIQVGYGPKTFERIARLRSARAALAARPRLRLADVAALGGFADQAHMARDSRALFGVPPSQWATLSS